MPRRSGRALLGALAAALLLAAPAAAHDAGSITHTVGETSATFEWDRADFGIANPRLHVDRAGVRYDITVVDVCEEGCIVFADEPDAKPLDSALKVVDLDGDGEPEVVLDTYSGGAHCCVNARVLSWNGTGYTPLDVFWGDPGYTMRDADRDGRLEMVGKDPVFSAAFTAYAASAFPPLILQFDHGRTVDVTRKFAAFVRADAKRWLRELRKAERGDDVRGVLAAYVADQYLLGKGSTGVAEIDRQRRAKRVSKGFKSLLLKQLRKWHYR